MRKTIRATAVISIAALGMLGVLSGPASADDGRSTRGSNEKINVYSGNHNYGGYVKFEHDGDKFTLYRATSPGNRIYAQYKKDNASTFETIIGGLYPGDKVTDARNLPDGTVYDFRGCIQVDSQPDPCSGVQHFTA